MSSLAVDEVLYAYITVAPYAVSLVLIQEDNGLQRPIYYVSKSIHEVEIRYSPLEKAILAVVHAKRCERRRCEKICLEKHRYTIRGPSGPYLRQRTPIR